jgi:acyl carrier protein
MSNDSVLAGRVIETISEQLKIAKEQVQKDASFKGDLGAESSALLELALALEETFGITFSDDDTDQMLTVGDAIKFVEQCSQKAG